MAQKLLHYLWFKFRPAEGWLPFALLFGAIVSGIITVIEVAWVPEDGVVYVAAFGGLLMSVGLAKRPLSALGAWLFITLYGFLIVTIHLANLWPRLNLLFFNPVALLLLWKQNGALFIDQFGSWIKALVTGGSSQETIVFAFALGLMSWFLTAYAGWSTFRNRKPLLGLTLMGLGVSINMFFGNVPPFWSAIFVGQVVLLTAVLQYTSLEIQWQENDIDFSEELRIDLVLYALAISAFLLTISYLLPGIPYTRIARAFVNQPLVQAAEDRFEALFGGVNQPGGSGPTPGGVGGVGLLPRSYLLGNPPELYEIVMMEAEVLSISEDERLVPAPYPLVQGNHWRGLSYETYTGKGWALTDERTELLNGQEPINLPDIQSEVLLFQRINWQRDNRLTRYTLGIPIRFEDEVTTYWRGLNDFVRVRGETQLYEAVSRISVATQAELRQTAVSNTPPALLARYTALPDSVPQRVHDLAIEVAGGLDNPFDQARALEQFLRQYPYSLDVTLPPPNQDPVDYFLFDLQAGYCDYYASAMVVMARSLGLPARLAVGYLPQPPDENGVQTVYQINGHSWAEVYFEGYGWIEFEPTAAFPSPRDESTFASPTFNNSVEADDLNRSPPIPENQTINSLLWGRLLLIGLAALGVLIWQAREWQKRLSDEIVWTYGRLQNHATKLGYSNLNGQTPFEFETQFTQYIKQISTIRSLRALIIRLTGPIQTIISQYVLHQYAPLKQGKVNTVKREWQKVKRPFWLLRFLHFFKRKNH